MTEATSTSSSVSSSRIPANMIGYGLYMSRFQFAMISSFVLCECGSLIFRGDECVNIVQVMGESLAGLFLQLYNVKHP